MAQFQVGERVHLSREWEFYPNGFFKAGTCGWVQSVDVNDGIFVLLDETNPDLDEWQNVLQIMPFNDESEYAPETFVEHIEATYSDFQALANRARPFDEDDYGSKRQVTAQNVFMCAVIDVMGDAASDNRPYRELDAYCEKATPDEMIEEALRVLDNDPDLSGSRAEIAKASGIY